LGDDASSLGRQFCANRSRQLHAGGKPGLEQFGGDQGRAPK
jgi:hypothetical protein